MAKKGKTLSEVFEDTDVTGTVPEEPIALDEPAPVEEGVVEPETITVRKAGLYKLYYSLVMGAPMAYSRNAGLQALARDLFGVEEYPKQVELWEKIKNEINQRG